MPDTTTAQSFTGATTRTTALPEVPKPATWHVHLGGAHHVTVLAQTVNLGGSRLKFTLDGETVADFASAAVLGYHRSREDWEPSDAVMRNHVDRHELAEIIADVAHEQAASEIWIPKLGLTPGNGLPATLNRHTGRMGQAQPAGEIEVRQFGQLALIDPDVLDQLFAIAGWAERGAIDLNTPDND